MQQGQEGTGGAQEAEALPVVVKHTSIYEAMAAIMVEVDPITKDRRNEKQGFAFRGVDDVYNMLHRIFARHQVFVLPRGREHTFSERKTASGGIQLHHIVKGTFVFCHSSGSTVEMDLYGECSDTGDKGAGKAQQYAYKIGLLQAFLIPTEGDNDPDAQGTVWGNNAPAQQQRPAQQQGSAPAARRQAPPRQDARRAPAGEQPSQGHPNAPPAAQQQSGLSPAQQLAGQLKKQLCATTSMQELRDEQARLRDKILEVGSQNKNTHRWLLDRIAEHEEDLKKRAPTQKAAS